MNVQSAVILTGLLIAAIGFALFLGYFRRKEAIPRLEELVRYSGQRGKHLPEVTWLGHSSFRLEWGNRVILLDPVLAARVSIAPRLLRQPASGALRGVTDILVSHAHMDHLDNGTLAHVSPCHLHLPEKARRFLRKEVCARHTVHGFQQGATLSAGPLDVHVVQARHGGWRYPWQQGHFACGFVISDGETRLYFAGDTAWGDHFEWIAQRFRPDIAILPIGGYSPRWFLTCRHMNPPEAVRAARILGARWVIPTHFGTYRVSMEPVEEPLAWFRRELPVT